MPAIRFILLRSITFWTVVCLAAGLLFALPWLLEPGISESAYDGSSQGGNEISAIGPAASLGLTILVVPYLMWFLQRPSGRLKAARLIAAGSVMAPLILLICFMVFVRDYYPNHNLSIRIDPPIFFPGAFFGAALYGVSMIQRKAWVYGGIVVLGAASTGGALFLAQAYCHIPPSFNIWTFDATQLEWKVPVAGTLLLAAGTLGATRRLGTATWFTAGWLRALLVVAGVFSLVSTSHYPRKWRVSDIGSIWGFRMAPNGDLFLNVTRKGHEIGWGPEATLIYEAGTRSLKCMSSRPLLAGRSLITSPEGTRVATTELASPWAVLTGRAGVTEIRNSRSGAKSTVWKVGIEDSFMGKIPDGTLILGPGQSHLFKMDGILYGCTMTGASFELPAGPNCYFPPAINGAIVRFYDEEITLDTGKATSISMPRLPDKEYLYQQNSPNGDRVAIYVPSVSWDQVSVYVVGPGVPDVILGSSPVAGQEDKIWPGVCWRDDGSATLVPASQIETCFSTYRNKERYGNLPVLRGSRVREMHEIGGRFFALLVDREHGASDGLYEIDPGFTHATRIRDAWQIQRIDDSIVYSTCDDPKGLVVRFWPKTNRREVLLAE